MGKPFRLLLFFAIVAVGLSLDLGTKHAAFSALGMPGEYRHETEPQLFATHWLIEGFFGFQTSLNQGALFGMGQGNVPLFAGCSLVAVSGILIWLLFFRGTERLFLTVVLGMVSAGILGNLYDRLGLPGLKWNYPDPYHEIGEPVYAVRDWILFMFGSWVWPNFNIADSLLVCGCILLGLYSLFAKEDSPQVETPS